jgi:hypothetical protein
MLLADLPYAHNTAAGSAKVSFFNPYSALELASQMEMIIKNDLSFLKPVPKNEVRQPYVTSWEELILLMLNNKK